MKSALLLLCLALGGHAFAQSIIIESFASGFNRPVDIQNAGDTRLFVVEQDGVIRIVDSSGSINSTPFLDIDSRVRSTGNEQGLLGLAFHPNYSSNGLFYVHYTNNSGGSTIAEYAVSSNANVADFNSERVLLTFSQPFSNHNGGAIAFSPIDGFLYIASGDGGDANDPGDRAQSTGNLLGKILRIDVNSGNPYAIPADNPFVGTAGADEIWAYGIRNPWRISFDSSNGDLWIGDVGQGQIEEINAIPPSRSGDPLNLGWRCYEGSMLNGSVDTTDCPDISTLEFPVAEYLHSGNGPFKCSITGGYVYRGSVYPGLVGNYVFADYCSNEIGLAIFDGSDWNIVWYGPFDNNNFSTFGVDQSGELYVAGLTSGTVYRIIDANLSTDTPSLESISIYPNPSSDFIRFQLPTQTTDLAATVTISDLLGRIHLKETVLLNNELQVDISRLSPGIYAFQLEDEQQRSVNRKIVVN